MEESRALIEKLRDPGRYPHACGEVELVETHISWVLLTGPRAYKIKKPVDLGFVDFSTLSRRKHFCEEELRLNRRLAQELYLRVLPITGSLESPAWDGDGPVLEYAVVMRQFDQRQLLSRLLEDDLLCPADVDNLGTLIGQFHGRIETADDSTEYGDPDLVLAPMEENFRQLQPVLSAVHRTQVELLQRWTRRQFEELRPLLRERKSAGMIRECHGDMHLGNIFLDPTGQPTVFDGIDFNPRLRWIDIISEIAFTVMDLEDRGRPDLAYRCLNAWLQTTGDFAGVRLLSFYLTYRALVRAKVAAIRLQQSADDSQTDHSELEQYLQLALQYTLPRSPALFITHGVSGSGKTTGTGPLLERLPGIRIRSDIERKRLFGLAPTQSSADADIYTADATQQTYARLADSAEHVLDAGFSTIVDATFLTRQTRRQFRRLARERDIPFAILDFAAPPDVLRQRVAARRQRGDDASEADISVLESQLRAVEPLDDVERSVSLPVTAKSDICAAVWKFLADWTPAT